MGLPKNRLPQTQKNRQVEPPQLTQQQALHFGRMPHFPGQALAGTPLWFPAVEFDGRTNGLDAVVGGVGVANRHIATSFSKYLKTDVRVIIPGYKKIDFSDKYQWQKMLSPDNLINLPSTDGHHGLFQIYTRNYRDPSNGANIHIYALVDADREGNIKSSEDTNTYFRQFSNLDFLTPDSIRAASEVYGVELDKGNAKGASYLMWNHAVSEAIIKLKAILHEEKPDILFMQDVSCTLFPYFMKEASPKSISHTGVVYMPQSIYDLVLDTSLFASLAPKSIPTGRVSMVGAGMNAADVILTDGPDFRDDLASRYEGNMQTREHPISYNLRYTNKSGPFSKSGKFPHLGMGVFDPRVSGTPEDTICSKQFTFHPLQVKSLRHVTARLLRAIDIYKTQNKEALYDMLEALPQNQPFQQQGGIVYGSLDRTNKNSKIFLYLHRVSPHKGNHWFLESIPNILGLYPDAQFVISSNSDVTNYNHFQTDLLALVQKYPGQVVFINGQPNQKIIYAGSDFSLQVTMEGPYGITPLEALRLGAVSIFHDVHGLRASTDHTRGIPVRRLTPEERIALNAYQVEREKEHPCIDATMQQTATRAVDSLVSSMKQALSLTRQDQLRLIANGMVYIENEHTWKHMIKNRYKPGLEVALSQARKRKA